MKPFFLLAVLGLAGLRFGTSTALGLDDAEILSTRVPNQVYRVISEEASALYHSGASWGISLWACDPATLTIHTTGLKHAPFAVRIVTRARDPIEEVWTGRRLPAIHLLAASKADALKMRSALIKEIEVMQRALERRQRKPPGYLREMVRSGR